MPRRARGGWKPGKDPKSLAKALARREKRVYNGLKKATEEVTEGLYAHCKKLAWPVRRISKQDAPGGKARVAGRRSAVGRRIDRPSLAGYVSVKGFWTAARTKAIRAIYARHGLDDKLKRRWLYVRQRVLNVTGQRGRKATAADYRWTAPVKKHLSRDPKLAQWAQNTKQDQRHVIYVSDRRVKIDLVLAAGLNKNALLFKYEFQQAIKKGLK